MFLGLGRKNKKKEKDDTKIEKKQPSIGEIYLECASYYIKYQGKVHNIENPLENDEFYREWATPFYNSAMYFVNYMENNYPDSVLVDDDVLDLDLSEMLEGADSTAKDLFFKPKFPELIYINESLYSTHLHTDGDVVFEAESIEVLPGLSKALANQKINKLFNGLTPIEVKELLKQMNIYPKDSELDQVISYYKEKEFVNYNFLKSIVCLLLIRRSNYDVKRARLFADSLGIYFDFAPFEKEQTHTLKKHD